MFVPERHRRILEHLKLNGSATLRELAELTGSSEVTTRRDLKALEQEGAVARRHGGAVIRHGFAYEQPYAEKARVAAAEKAAIAARAAELVEPGDAIVLGAGTTTQTLARLLVHHAGLTVVTNSLLVAEALVGAEDVEVHVTGGTLRASIQALVGPAAERSLAGFRTARVFLSGNGITAERGLTTPNPMVASIDQALVAAAREVVVLADGTKVGQDAMCQTVPAERIGRLIVDQGAGEDELARLRELGVDVEVVKTVQADAASASI